MQQKMRKQKTTDHGTCRDASLQISIIGYEDSYMLKKTRYGLELAIETYQG